MEDVGKGDIIVSMIFLGQMSFTLLTVYMRFPWDEFRQRKDPGFKVSVTSAAAFLYSLSSCVVINLWAMMYYLTDKGRCGVLFMDGGFLNGIAGLACGKIYDLLMLTSVIAMLLFPIAGLGLSIAANRIVEKDKELKMKELASLSQILSFFLLFMIVVVLAMIGLSNMNAFK